MRRHRTITASRNHTETLAGDSKGSASTGYVIAVGAGLVVMGALSAVGTGFERSVDDGTQARPSEVGGSGWGAGADDGNANNSNNSPGSQSPSGWEPPAWLTPPGTETHSSDSNGDSTSVAGERQSGDLHKPSNGYVPPGYVAPPSRAQAPLGEQSVAESLAQQRARAESSLSDFSEDFYKNRVRRQYVGNAYAASGSSTITVELPGRLPHEVGHRVAGLDGHAQANLLNELDREAWSDSPRGAKPVAAWNHGDGVGALLSDVLLLNASANGGETGSRRGAVGGRPDPIPGAILSDGSIAGGTFAGGTFGRDADEAAAGRLLPFANVVLGVATSLAASEALRDLADAAKLRSKLDSYSARADKLRDQLKALDALGKSTDLDLSDQRSQLARELETVEKLELLLTLELARFDWDAENADMDINAISILRSMAPLSDKGPLAEIRDMYWGEGASEMSTEELLRAIVGTDLHDASVQQVLREHRESILAEIASTEASLASGVDNLEALTAELTAEANAIEDERYPLRKKRKEKLKKLRKLLKNHEKAHARGLSQGLSKKEWDLYNRRKKNIKKLTDDINELQDKDRALAKELAAFNANAKTLSAGYQAVESQSTFDDVKSRKFFSSRPVPPPPPASRATSSAPSSTPKATAKKAPSASGASGGSWVQAYENGAPSRMIQVVYIQGKPVEVNSARAFEQMSAAAAADGIHLQLNSGFRTMEQQQALYACYISPNCAQPNTAVPGTSNHQNGRALDIQTNNYWDGPEYRWLANNAHRFGFVNTLSREKVAAHLAESWHWEYWP